MDKSWADKNKEIQALLAKEATFKEAIKKLLEFRGELFQQITWIVEAYPDEAFYQMPFAGAKGYHSKTLAYSIWHIFRIEDIVAHEMIAGDEQILIKSMSGFIDNGRHEFSPFKLRRKNDILVIIGSKAPFVKLGKDGKKGFFRLKESCT